MTPEQYELLQSIRRLQETHTFVLMFIVSLQVFVLWRMGSK